MRKIILLATTAVVITLGAASANANPNLRPEQTPYAVLEPQTVAPLPTSEGRAAFTNDNADRWSGYLGAAPVVTTPEDRTYYSRGR